MFDDENDWRRKRLRFILQSAAIALGACLLLVIAPALGLERGALMPFLAGIVGSGLGVGLVVFRRGERLAPETVERIEAAQAGIETRSALAFWASAVLWLGSWLTWDLALGGGWTFGIALLFLGFLPLLLVWPDLLRSLRRDAQSAWNPALHDERARAVHDRTMASAGLIAFQVALWLSALSLVGIWPLAGHELGLLTGGAFLLAAQTRTALQARRDARQQG